MRVHTLDLGFKGLPETIAAYLVEGPSGAVLVETGPMSTLEGLLADLRAQGVEPGDVRHVLLSHIHLDHAGAAGWWAQQGATVHVHHRGAEHLVDPSRLLASAQRIYGDEMDSLWGGVPAAPAEKVSSVNDGDLLRLAGLQVEAMDVPGHAKHHMVYVVEGAAFTGDAAGIRLPGSDTIDLPAPPPEFDREAWYESIGRLEALRLRTLYPTHFGAVENVVQHLRDLRTLIAEASGLVRGMLTTGADRPTMLREYLSWNVDRHRLAGAGDDRLRRLELANPYEMSVDGIARYWRKRGVGSP